MLAAEHGRLAVVHHVLTAGGASITATSKYRQGLWDRLAIVVKFGKVSPDHPELPRTLRLVLLLEEPPGTFADHLLSQLQPLVTEGNRLRDHGVPAYLEWRSEVVAAHLSVSLDHPGLFELVVG